MFRAWNLTSLNPNIPMPNSLEQTIFYLGTSSTKHFLQRKPPIPVICYMNGIKTMRWLGNLKNKFERGLLGWNNWLRDEGGLNFLSNHWLINFKVDRKTSPRLLVNHAMLAYQWKKSLIHWCKHPNTFMTKGRNTSSNRLSQ